MAVPPIPAATELSSATNGDETELFVSLDETTWTGELEIDELPDLPSGEQSLYETTHMKSGLFKEWKKNKRRDGSEIEISGNYVIGSTGEATLLAMEAAGGSLAYQIVLKQNAETWRATGRGLFSSLKRTNPMEEKRRFTITMKPVTPMTLAKDA
jgi:hypothetical protein